MSDRVDEPSVAPALDLDALAQLAADECADVERSRHMGCGSAPSVQRRGALAEALRDVIAHVRRTGAAADAPPDRPADGAMHETERAEFDRLYRECLSAHEAETHGWGNGATAAHGDLVAYVRQMLSRRAALASARPLPDACESVTASIRYPDHVAHLPSERCQTQEPHEIAACGEFDRASARPAGAEADALRGAIPVNLRSLERPTIRDLLRDAILTRTGQFTAGGGMRVLLHGDELEAIRAFVASAPAPARGTEGRDDAR